MNISSKNYSPETRQAYFSISRVPNFSSRSVTHKTINNKGSIINNEKISDSLNANILKLKLRSVKYKTGESELRQILNTSTTTREKSEIIPKSKSISRNNIVKQRKSYKKFDSSLNTREADMIVDEYRYINKQQIWKSVIANFKANPKQLLDLVPISLSNKKDLKDLSPLKSREKPLKTLRIQEHSNKPSPFTPDIVETLKEQKNQITEDWARSLLHYNIKHKNSKVMYENGYSEIELKELLNKPILTNNGLLSIRKDLLTTLENLLVELLGTEEDYLNFVQIYSDASPAALKTLIVKCLDLYQLRAKTASIIHDIRKRESILKKLKPGDKKTVIEVHKISKNLRTQIKKWVADEDIPFDKFIFKGVDYLDKLSNDLITLQAALIPTDKPIL
jgi:hypothetical protein